MNIKEALLAEHSKAQTMRIVQYIGTDKDRFETLMQLFLNEEYRICQRASWVVSFIAEKYPDMILPYLETMILNLKNPVHDAVKRNTVRILSGMDTIPEHLLGMTVDICFHYISTPLMPSASSRRGVTVPVAIKAFSMRVLYKICLKEPDLMCELRLIIEDMMPHETAAFKSAGKDVLKKLKSL
jgi:hypothetical protein